MHSVKLAHSHEERTSNVKIVPNPFGGVNTHLWSDEAYIVGIVPVVRSAYSPQSKKWKRNRREVACLLGSVCRDKTWRAI
jgi:hypothetical protein